MPFSVNRIQSAILEVRGQRVILDRTARPWRPRAVTEPGVAMLSSVLRSERAVEVHIAIMRSFVRTRHPQPPVAS